MMGYGTVPYFQTKPTWSICNSIFRPGKTVWNRIWMCCCQALHHIVPMCSPRQVDKMFFPKSMEVGSQEGSQSGAMCCGTCHRIFVIERLYHEIASDCHLYTQYRQICKHIIRIQTLTCYDYQAWHGRLMALQILAMGDTLGNPAN